MPSPAAVPCIVVADQLEVLSPCYPGLGRVGGEGSQGLVLSILSVLSAYAIQDGGEVTIAEGHGHGSVGDVVGDVVDDVVDRVGDGGRERCDAGREWAEVRGNGILTPVHTGLLTFLVPSVL